jgi:chromate transporter
LKPPLSKLTNIFLRIGNTTFGGGYVTIGMLGRELIDNRRWLAQDKFDLAFALSRVTPGTNVLAFCAAVGAQLRGWLGAFAAVLAVSVPSSLIALFFIYAFNIGEHNRVAAAAIAGTVAAVAGMMWSTIWTILRPQMGGIIRNLQVLILTGGAFLASWKFKITPLPIIGVGLLIGLFWKDPGKKEPSK